MAVVTAFKLDDVFAIREGTGEANGAHGGFGAGADEAHFFDGGVSGEDEFGEVAFGLGGRAEAGAVCRRFLDGFDDGRKGVAEDHGAPGAEVVDVAVAISVPEPGPFAANDEGR